MTIATGFALRQFNFAEDFAAACAIRPNSSEVHIWLVDSSSADLETLASFLSEEETARAARIRVPQPRAEYIAGRASLRQLLSKCLDCAPHTLRFGYTRHEKPWLEYPQSSLNFNLSHSGGLVLIALTDQRGVGIDIERVRWTSDLTAVAERFFSQAERTALRQVPDRGKAEAFFRCWTRKEAYIKARGEGLWHPLRQFDVDFDREESCLRETRPDPAEATRWLLLNVPVPDGYAAALAVEAQLPGFAV